MIKALSGALKPDNDEVMACAPEIVVVGGAITRVDDLASVAREMKRGMSKHASHG